MTLQFLSTSAIVALCFVSVIRPLYGQSLMVTPKRIVLDDRKRAQVVTLYNNADDTMSYTVKWQHFRMQENGQYVEIDSVTPEDLVADSLVRFFPPEITLPPHSAQIVRVRYLKPKGLVQAEYRSHLAFAGIAPAKPFEWQPGDTSSTQVSFHPVWGVSIPILVRSDTAPAVVSLDSVSISKMDAERNVLVFAHLNRSGGQSSYGKVVVKYVAPGGHEIEIAYTRNIAVFPPLRTRKLMIPVKMPTSVDLSKGRIVVEYQTDTGALSEHVQASAELALQR